VIVARGIEGVASDPQSVVTVGTFDGVHRAHREIIREIVTRARKNSGRSVVVTFHPHPRQVVGGGGTPVRLLNTIDERIALLGELGVDLLVVLAFTPEFSQQTPDEFFRRYVVEGTGVSEIVVGYDHMFGRDRAAGISDLVRLGQEFDFSVFTLLPYAVDGQTVSSTAIRQALEQGDVERAASQLGYAYMLSGGVVHGDSRGRTLGFPTANVIPDDPAKILPARGVYLVGFRHAGAERFGMMNIGVRPTLGPGGPRMLEVHVFDFDGDLYGEQVTVTFLRRVREERRFTSVDELSEQLRRDREVSMKMLAQRGV
jgi:riboflavin kinase / FMN adenylyltransferase